MPNTGFRILLIEDDEAFAFLTKRSIAATGSGHSVTHVVRIEHALQELAGDEFDIVLTDLSLPDASGIESVELLRAFHPEMPIIVLTSLESEDPARAAIQAGAQDYIYKDLVTSVPLDLSIRHAIERQRIASENARLIEQQQVHRVQLKQQNERLQQLVETAHRFVDNVSHEFRTPLTVIREYASLMRDEVLGEINEEQAEFLDVIGYRVDDLNTMVDDMLDSSKLEVGLMTAHRESTSPIRIVERALSGLQLKAQVRGVKLGFDTADDLPDVFCDAEKAGRVITNLVSNALKFCDEDAGEVWVEVTHQPDTRDVRISVKDNGSGIDADGLSKLFERFRQLGTSTQSSTKGFGLGLNIARELVDLNYGKITVNSTVGKGSTFAFTIPVDDWAEVVRRFSTRLALKNVEASVVVVRASVDDPDETALREIDAFWRFTERHQDLIRMTSSGEWTLLIACQTDEIDAIIDRFHASHAQVSRNRPTPLPALSFEINSDYSPAEDVNELVNAACQKQCSPELPAGRKGWPLQPVQASDV
jgi:signal transduction histidine kinase